MEGRKVEVTATERECLPWEKVRGGAIIVITWLLKGSKSSPLLLLGLILRHSPWLRSLCGRRPCLKYFSGQTQALSFTCRMKIKAPGREEGGTLFFFFVSPPPAAESPLLHPLLLLLLLLSPFALRGGGGGREGRGGSAATTIQGRAAVRACLREPRGWFLCRCFFPLPTSSLLLVNNSAFRQQ